MKKSYAGVQQSSRRARVGCVPITAAHLAHKIGYDSVEGAAFVVQGLLKPADPPLTCDRGRETPIRQGKVQE